MLWKEILIGFLIAGFLMLLVPDDWWGKLFITHDTGFLRLVENAVVGPLIGAASFACSCGNIPLASVPWSGGISFGGVIAFIFADLIVLPILNIYRKYYGLRMAGFLFVTFYAAMAAAALLVELLFAALGLIPQQRNALVVEASINWDYTTWLNIAFLALAAYLVARMLLRAATALGLALARPRLARTTDVFGLGAETSFVRALLRSIAPRGPPRVVGI